MNTLHAYMSYAGDASEGALLVFAHTAREAIRVSAREIQNWTDCMYIDVRAHRLRAQEEYLLSLGTPAKLAAGEPHIIDDPPSCRSCAKWGYPIAEDGSCAWCEKERAESEVSSQTKETARV